MKTFHIVALAAVLFAGAASAQTAPPDTATYRLTDVEVLPEVRNRAAVARAIERSYPAELKAAGIGGSVTVSILVDARGAPAEVAVHEGSGHAALDRAAVEVARVMRFSPAEDMVNGKYGPVPVRIRIPLRFTPAP